jgi:Bacterial Ig-like domain
MQRCAQITPLTGGKKDTTAPKPLVYMPANASLNFNTKTIEITFNEFIALKDLTNQFIITPQTASLPDIEAVGKKLRIKFTETLLKNTTYKLSFGNAIIDIHEGTAIDNFEYIFSTGNEIDSLRLGGTVYSAIDKQPQGKLLVGLYDANTSDSSIYKLKPLYVGKTNTEGKFNFSYLPNKEFKIRAIKDDNKNLVYDGSEEQIAFTNELVKPTALDSNSQNLFLFKETPTKRFVKKTISNEYGKATVVYNKPQANIISIKGSSLYSYTTNATNDTLIIYYANCFDTLTVYPLFGTNTVDTVILKIPSKTSFDKTKSAKGLLYQVSSNLKKDFAYFDMPQVYLNFPIAYKLINKNKIALYEYKDTVKVKKEFEIMANQNSQTSFFIKTTILAEHSYQLNIDKDAFNDSIRKRTNDSISFKFTTTPVDDYAQLTLKLFFPRKENYILMLFDEKGLLIKKMMIEFSLTSSSEKNIVFSNLIPGNYCIRVVEDVNKNGLFDTGNYLNNKQPETIFINTTPIKLLAGWEIENEWIIK